ncbi:hypothetical protein [Bradyrhizobium diazoefficiens]|uniref:hypothetical protein n=1 Tax=Bradyrhizobium diazoefficiens TaxID=1355477 RepID=UPI001B8C1255|nr:hypothetical protein [Bradyrhizobium diazoefficiens]MBR0891817.1 hypothetical protein [Bradyrhizobium diazoefficiens]
MTKVHHVAHVPDARRILEDKRVRSGLIYDESRLNRTRTCVSWASANTWVEGSIYGNVQFTFDWADIIRGRRVYWVEDMPDYSPPAYRLLLTDRDLSPGVSRNVIAYDPAVDKGPLREREGDWYWNDDYTSEFMIEDDLPLRLCRGVSFIRHRRDICRLHGCSCGDRTASEFMIGGRIMAFLLGSGVHSLDRTFRRPASMRSRLPLLDSVERPRVALCFGEPWRTTAPIASTMLASWCLNLPPRRCSTTPSKGWSTSTSGLKAGLSSAARPRASFRVRALRSTDRECTSYRNRHWRKRSSRRKISTISPFGSRGFISMLPPWCLTASRAIER